MTLFVVKSAAAIAAAAGLAYASVETVAPDPAYDGGMLRSLTQDQIASHAERVFARADRNDDAALDVDEYSALMVATAELARLNGFIVVELGEDPGLIALPVAGPAALPRGEHVRIAAVAQNRFYAFAGADGKMSAGEFAAAEADLFDAADRNGNGRLGRGELSLFAQRQANMMAGV